MDFYFDWSRLTFVFKKFQVIINFPFKLDLTGGFCWYLNKHFCLFSIYWRYNIFVMEVLGIEFAYFRKEE